MDENEKRVLESTENKPLNDGQLTNVSGGEIPQIITQPVRHKICAADPSHIYVEPLTKCPICGTKEYTYI